MSPLCSEHLSVGRDVQARFLIISRDFKLPLSESRIMSYSFSPSISVSSPKCLASDIPMKSVYKNIWETAKVVKFSIVMPCKTWEIYNPLVFHSSILVLVYHSSSTPRSSKHPFNLSFYPCIPM